MRISEVAEVSEFGVLLSGAIALLYFLLLFLVLWRRPSEAASTDTLVASNATSTLEQVIVK